MPSLNRRIQARTADIKAFYADDIRKAREIDGGDYKARLPSNLPPATNGLRSVADCRNEVLELHQSGVQQ